MFKLIAIFFWCIMIQVILFKVLTKQINATITKCNYTNGNLSSIDFTYIYDNVKYEKNNKRLGLLPTCKVGDAYPIEVSILFPSHYET